MFALVVQAVSLAGAASSADKRLLGLCAAGDGDTHVDEVRELLTAGGSTMFTDLNNNTCLYFASRLGNVEVVRALLDADAAMVHVGNSLGQSPLHAAVHSRSGDIVQLLLEHGARADFQMLNGATPIDLAREGGDKRIIGLFDEMKRPAATDRAAKDAAMTELTNALVELTYATKWGANQNGEASAETALERLEEAIGFAREAGVEPEIIDPIAHKYLQKQRVAVSPHG